MEGFGESRNFGGNGHRNRCDPHGAWVGYSFQPLFKRHVKADSSLFQQSRSLPQTDVAEPWALIRRKAVQCVNEMLTQTFIL